jgi:hypothetical protein
VQLAPGEQVVITEPARPTSPPADVAPAVAEPPGRHRRRRRATGDTTAAHAARRLTRTSAPYSSRSGGLLDLGHRVAGQLVDDEHGLGLLEPGQLAVQPGEDRWPSTRAVGAGHDGGDHRLAEVRVGHAEHGRLGHPGQGVDEVLDLLRGRR